MIRFLKEFFSENLSYKVVSLLIAVILWITILGRRDFVYTKTVDVEFRTAAGMSVVAQTADRVKVRVSGPRASLKKYMESMSSQALVLDISDRGDGLIDVDVPLNKIEIPLGVKILGVRPNMIRAEVVPNDRHTPPPANE